MSGAGAPAPGGVQAAGLQIAIVAASWHEVVMTGLVDGALRACQESGAVPTVVRVPGAFELPVAAAACAQAGYAAIAALGTVIRGGTPHFEYVCDAATSGLARVALDYRVPVGFGLLTCDTEAQALDRAGLADSREDKGREAVEAALATALVLAQLPTP